MHDNLVPELLAGSFRALARVISLIENESSDSVRLLEQLHPHTGAAYRLGITGPSGAGKSTLADRLAKLYRADGNRVGIITVDPTSPFSGGAFLGDRLRMSDLYGDEGVFIRSMATRGSHGGLPRTTRNAVKLLDAYGSDVIIVETVGVGQAELDIMDVVDTVVVVLVPEGGDSMQAMKAGLMEIADVFVVNKADRPGADAMMKDITAMLSWDTRERQWVPPVLSSQAHQGIGIEELWEAIEKHRKVSEDTGLLAVRRRERRRHEFFRTIREQAEQEAQRLAVTDGSLAALLKQVESNSIDPYTAALIAVKQLSARRRPRKTQ
ncbi:MAG: methylmalonyl Co-A mutase-associated GTPase MeaB [Candidatus Marinimicrobia bacterium]|nr:methylmalonyl Co-A mutase-associated GTPase MeaB [Candidatus Neomarinimicrobiota bacterium]